MAEIATTPEASPTGGADSYLSEMMAGIEAPSTPKTPEASKTEPSKPEKPETPPKDVKDAKTPAAKTAAKPDAAKPGDKPPKQPQQPQKPKDDVAQLRKRKEELEAYEKTAKSEIAKLQEENRKLAGKRYVTPEMEKEVEANKAEIQRLKGQLSESAYEHSDEFKSKFVEPWQRTLQSTLAMVEQMQTPVDEETGQSRKTTQADFQRVLAAPVGEQSEMAQKLFGANALRILTQIDKLNDLKQQAEASVKAQATTLDGKRKQMESWENEQRQKYTTLRESARKELVEKYPQFFGPDETDPEASESLAKGFEFVDKATESANDLSADERAAYAEVIRARAAWFPRGFRELSKAKEKIASLEEDLAKFRASDPGDEKEKGRITEKKDDEMGVGIAGLADVFGR